MIRDRERPLAVQRAFTLGAVAGATALSAPAQAQESTTPTADAGSSDINIQTVVVTGSHVRRVDTETASPVFFLDQAAITETGAATIGDLINRIPSIAGAAINPQINNGGGFGESNIELRGLAAGRTLILIDGQRVNLVGASGAVDVNQIPLNYIDHVEVLKEGAGAVYGSDAISGVVNFITRKNFEGVELTGDWGESTKHDAQHHEVGLLWGAKGDRSSFTFGASYNQQDALNMGQRKWSGHALYLYSGSLFAAGSSRTPTGRIKLPASLISQFNCPAASRNTVTRIVGTDGTQLSDYRCFTPGPDSFNFQPYNLNVTPQERAAFFTKANYDINDHLSSYAQVVYNHTHSGSQLAPLPFDANADGIIISKNNIYNPFGTDFGGGALVNGANPNLLVRLTGIGDRSSDTDSTSVISRAGVKGKIPGSEWEYDGSVSYNTLNQTSHITGYLFGDKLQNAVGPSFIDPTTGAPTCGTPTAIIPDCTPANIFDLQGPGQQAAVSGFSAYFDRARYYASKALNIDLNGPVMKLPAGEVLGAAGVAYTGLSGQFTTSAITQAQPPLYTTCQLSSETCGGNSAGNYSFKEIYGELLIPVLADLPGAKVLNVDAGIRWSDYSLFGSTNRAAFKLEYRPVRDVLVRGTFAQIFRAPTINDISLAPATSAPTFNDLCAGYRGVNTSAYPHLVDACQGVPTDGTFKEPQNQVTGLLLSNRNLKPETGDVKTFGVVFDPSSVPGLSVSADYWSYKVDGLLTALDPNFAIGQCATTGSPTFCNLIQRYPGSSASAGQVLVIDQPTFNLGGLTTDGVDFNVTYSLKRTPLGDFRLTIDETHLMTYINTAAPGAAAQEIAGTYNKEFGFFTKDRAIVTVGWSGWGADALLSTRYIGPVSIPLTNHSPTGFLGWHMGSVEYYDLTVGYTYAPTNTRIQVGMLNIADKTPPIAGINSFAVGSSVTDVTTYDTIGRRFFVGLMQRF
jgi:outer membrane receptor protein involved in Fe transport